MKIIKANNDKNIKERYRFENKLIVFIYYFKLFFTLSYDIKSFYKIYLIYLIT